MWRNTFVISGLIMTLAAGALPAGAVESNGPVIVADGKATEVRPHKPQPDERRLSLSKRESTSQAARNDRPAKPADPGLIF